MAFASSRDFTINHSRFVDNSVINNITTSEAKNQGANGWQKFLKAVSMDASFDSQARYPPPHCDENTRTALLEHILHWIDSGEEDILFLDGPAGAGKSAVAQTVAAMCAERNSLAGSYFFFRGSPSQNTITPFIPTIAYHITSSTVQEQEEFKTLVKGDPFILDRSSEAQLHKLVLEPHKRSPATNFGRRPILIVDGLDECNGDNNQRRVVKLLGQLVDKQHAIVRCLVASRPEPQILAAVNSLPTNVTVARVTLNKDTWNAEEDTRTYLRSHFNRISSRLPPSAPRPWPSDTILETLVRKAGGMFIYASTVIKYIDDEDTHPTKQLENALSLPPGTTPFAQLDMLYQQILMACPLQHHEILLHIIGFVFLHKRGHPDISMIEAVLGLSPGDVVVALRRMHSILTIITDYFGTSVRFLHTSFGDFIFNKERSGTFFIDRERESLFLANKCIDYMEGKLDCSIFMDHAQETTLYTWIHWSSHGEDAGDSYFVDLVMKLHHCDKSLWGRGLFNELGCILGLTEGIQWLKDIIAKKPLHLISPGLHHGAVEELSRKLCEIMLDKLDLKVLSVFEDPGIGFFGLLLDNRIVALVQDNRPPTFLYLHFWMRVYDLGWWDAYSALTIPSKPECTQDKDEQTFLAIHCLDWVSCSTLGLQYAIKHWAKHISLSNNTNNTLLEILQEAKLQIVDPGQQVTLGDINMVIQWLEGNSSLKWQRPELLSLWEGHHWELRLNSDLGLCFTTYGKRLLTKCIREKSYIG